MHTYIPLALLFILPLTAAAAPLPGTFSLQNFFTAIPQIINNTLIPFLFGIAFLFFAINIIRYFVAGAGNKDAQEKAKNVAIYGVIAFVFLSIFWGIINMFAASTGLEDCAPVTSDYLEYKSTGPFAAPCI